MADFAHRHAAQGRHQLADRGCAEAALAGTHAAAGEGLELVRPEAAQRHRRADITHRDLLATADDGLVAGGTNDLVRRRIQPVQQGAHGEMMGDVCPPRPRPVVAFVESDAARSMGDIQDRQMAGPSMPPPITMISAVIMNGVPLRSLVHAGGRRQLRERRLFMVVGPRVSSARSPGQIPINQQVSG